MLLLTAAQECERERAAEREAWNNEKMQFEKVRSGWQTLLFVWRSRRNPGSPSFPERAESVFSHAPHGLHLNLSPSQDIEYLEGYIEDANSREDDLQEQLAAKDEAIKRVAASFGIGAMLVRQAVHRA